MVKRLLLIFTSLAMICGASELRADAPLRSEVRRIPARGLENFFSIATNLYSGGSPEGEVGFATLKKLGIKTIITVDGARPDVERAHAFGLHYVHLPHGYDGIPLHTQLELIKAFQTVEGPIYIHCHHGQHRGPVAAAAVCMAAHNWSRVEAEAWLRAAGTGTNYQGLYATVRHFEKPTIAQLTATKADFVEAKKLSGLVDSMVSIDETFDRLRSLQGASVSAKPDNHLLNEATLLREHFREAQRLADAQRRGAAFLQELSAAESEAASLEDVIGSSSERGAMDRAIRSLGNSCVACHRAHRDQPVVGSKTSLPLGR